MSRLGKLVLLFGLATLAISIILFVWGVQIFNISGQGILDMQFGGRTPELVDQTLSAYQGNQSFAIYSKIQSLDMLYPLAYGGFGVLWLYALFKPTAWRYLAVVPFMSAMFDFAENTLLGKIVSSYPELNAEIIERSSLYTNMKYGTIVLSLVFLAFGLIRWKRAK